MMVETRSGNNTTSNIEYSDRWQTIDLKRSGSTSVLAWNLKFSQKTNQPSFDLWFGTNVEQGMIFQITSRKTVVAPEILEMFNFSELYNVIQIVKLLHLCRVINVQFTESRYTRSFWSYKHLLFKLPLSTMTSACAKDLTKDSLNYIIILQNRNPSAMPIVSQLSKCLKFEAIRGRGTGTEWPKDLYFNKEI